MAAALAAVAPSVAREKSLPSGAHGLNAVLSLIVSAAVTFRLQNLNWFP